MLQCMGDTFENRSKVALTFASFQDTHRLGDFPLPKLLGHPALPGSPSAPSLKVQSLASLHQSKAHCSGIARWWGKALYFAGSFPPVSKRPVPAGAIPSGVGCCFFFAKQAYVSEREGLLTDCSKVACESYCFAILIL